MNWVGASGLSDATRPRIFGRCGFRSDECRLWNSNQNFYSSLNAMILRPSTLARGRIVLSRASRSYATKPIPATQLKKDAIPKRLPANKPLERPYVYSVENKNPSNLCKNCLDPS